MDALAKRVFVGERVLPPVPRRLLKIIETQTPPGKLLRAGVAKVDIAPSGSITMRGFTARQSTGLRRHHYVRALVLDNCDSRLAISSCEKFVPYDLPRGFKEVASLREEISKRTGIPSGNILINATHTHSGCEGAFEETSIEAVANAWERMREARIGIVQR